MQSSMAFAMVELAEFQSESAGILKVRLLPFTTMGTGCRKVSCKTRPGAWVCV
jgi:hypothetical protein